MIYSTNSVQSRRSHQRVSSYRCLFYRVRRLLGVGDMLCLVGLGRSSPGPIGVEDLLRGRNLRVPLTLVGPVRFHPFIFRTSSRWYLVLIADDQ